MRKQLALAALMGAVSFAAPAAESLSYTFLEGGYARQSKDELPSLWGGVMQTLRPHAPDTDGIFVGGSFAITDSWYAFGNYRRGTDDVDVDTFDLFWGQVTSTAKHEVTATTFNLGVGYRYGVTDSTDLLAEFSAHRMEFDIQGDRYPEDPSTDLRVSVGVRSAFGPMEAWAKASYTDIGPVERGSQPDGFSATGGLQYKFNPTLGIVGEYEGGDGYSQFTLGLRASF